MQVADVQRIVSRCKLQRIITVRRDLVEIAFVETHTLAALDIDRRYDLHAVNPRKFRSSPAPTADERSG